MRLSVVALVLLVACALAQKPSGNFPALRKDLLALMQSNPGYDDGSYGPLLLRLSWHASGTYDKNDGTGGSGSGAMMRWPPEANWAANAGLDVARDLLEPLKAKYTNISYSDLWSYAGVVAIESMGGPVIPWRTGRKDATSPKNPLPDGRLPDASQGAAHLRAVFGRMGFNDQDIVVLSGAHSMGRAHSNRSGYEGPWTPMPTRFTNTYYSFLLHLKWTPKKWTGPLQFEDPAKLFMMLPTDIALITDPIFKSYVQTYATDQKKWSQDFAIAYQKLEQLGVKFSHLHAQMGAHAGSDGHAHGHHGKGKDGDKKTKNHDKHKDDKHHDKKPISKLDH